MRSLFEVEVHVMLDVRPPQSCGGVLRVLAAHLEMQECEITELDERRLSFNTNHSAAPFRRPFFYRQYAVGRVFATEVDGRLHVTLRMQQSRFVWAKIGMSYLAVLVAAFIVRESGQDPTRLLLVSVAPWAFLPLGKLALRGSFVREIAAALRQVPFVSVVRNVA